MQLILYIILILLFSIKAFAFENLTEIEARKSRKSVNTFYSGESAGSYYRWQPQTLSYIDTTSGHEIWLFTQTDDVNSATGNEYGHQPWSADGKYFALMMNKNTSSFTRTAEYWEWPWLVARSDGTMMKPQPESSARTGYASYYRDWSPVEPDTYFAFGVNLSGNSGLDSNMIYKHTVTDTATSRQTWCDTILLDTSTEIRQVKGSIPGDGKYYLGMTPLEKDPVYICRIDSSPGLTLTYTTPAMDTYWWDTPSSWTGWHDENFVGNDTIGYWIYFVPGSSYTWWRMRPWGTDSGTPNHTTDNTDPYDWWEGTEAQKEMQPVDGLTGNAPWVSVPYWSHGLSDRWGKYIAFSDTEVNVTPAVWNVDTHTSSARLLTNEGCQYHCWTGWTDYSTGTAGAGTAQSDVVYSLKYNDGLDYTRIAYLHSTIVNDFTAPGQSPDGTKTAARSDWLNPTSGIGDVFVVVAYYPYPPAIKSVTAAGGTVTVTVEWDLDGTPRGYTARGWPDEAVNTPPPPREIEKFRLWHSLDGSAWTAVETFDHTVWSTGQNSYNFSTGVWGGDGAEGNWSTTEAYSSGVSHYFAITSIEYSGLESRALSNIYEVLLTGGNGTGSQHAAYPAAPGTASNFYTTAPSKPTNLNRTHQLAPATTAGQYTITWNAPASATLVRYYNIYAEDGAIPDKTQQHRIASIPATTDYDADGAFSWVDWLGNTNGGTLYGISAVDYQGNESEILTDGPTQRTVTISSGPQSVIIDGGPYTLTIN
jgi:hypothetical protein